MLLQGTSSLETVLGIAEAVHLRKTSEHIGRVKKLKSSLMAALVATYSCEA